MASLAKVRLALWPPDDELEYIHQLEELESRLYVCALKQSDVHAAEYKELFFFLKWLDEFSGLDQYITPWQAIGMLHLLMSQPMW